MDKKVYFDTETTGLKPGQICQLSMLTMEDYKLASVDNYFFAVDYVEEGAQKIHGFSKEMLDGLSGGKVFEDYADEIYEKLSNCCLIAHNIKFDKNFVTTEFARLHMPFHNNYQFDTMTYFNPIMKMPSRSDYYRGSKNPKLCEVLDFLHIDIGALQAYTNELFRSDGVDFHDSRFDTTSLLVMTSVWGELANHNAEIGLPTPWIDRFGLKG